MLIIQFLRLKMSFWAENWFVVGRNDNLKQNQKLKIQVLIQNWEF